MELSKEQIDEIIKRLKIQGLAGDFPINNPSAIQFLQNKHYSRYIEAIIFARHKQISTTWSALSRIYRIDLVVRRMIDERLKPIELEMKTHLMHFFEFNNYDFSDLEEGKLLEDYSEVLKIDIRKRQRDTIAFVKESIRKIVEKNPRHTLIDVVNEFSLGQTVGLISILNNEAFKVIFPNVQIEKKRFAKILERVVDLRNHIAHLKTVLTLKPISQNKHSTFMIKQLLQDLKSVGRGDLVIELEAEYNKYKNNALRSLHDSAEKDMSVDDLSAIFEKIKVFIF